MTSHGEDWHRLNQEDQDRAYEDWTNRKLERVHAAQVLKAVKIKEAKAKQRYYEIYKLRHNGAAPGKTGDESR